MSRLDIQELTGLALSIVGIITLVQVVSHSTGIEVNVTVTLETIGKNQRTYGQ